MQKPINNNLYCCVLILLAAICFQSCGIYSFTGTSIAPETKTFQVKFFNNRAPIVVPGIDQTFTLQLQDLILNQTSLDLVTKKGDLIYEGDINQYYTAPLGANSENGTDQNRLTIGVKVRFSDTKNPDKNLEEQFSFFFDFSRTQTENSIRDEAIPIIYERITQDIFNATLARW